MSLGSGGRRRPAAARVMLVALDGREFVEVDRRQLDALVDCGAVEEAEDGSWCLTPDLEFPGEEEDEVMESLYRMGRLG